MRTPITWGHLSSVTSAGAWTTTMAPAWSPPPVLLPQTHPPPCSRGICLKRTPDLICHLTRKPSTAPVALCMTSKLFVMTPKPLSIWPRTGVPLPNFLDIALSNFSHSALTMLNISLCPVLSPPHLTMQFPLQGAPFLLPSPHQNSHTSYIASLRKASPTLPGLKTELAVPAEGFHNLLSLLACLLACLLSFFFFFF